jgi:transcriptional regulator with XRE-family HTH domain
MARKRNEAADRLVQLGKMLREARRDQFTVEELAERAGVSSGLISQIERGRGNPSFATLEKLVRALDLSLASVFAEPATEASMVVRGKERPKLVMPKEGLVYELMTPRSGNGLAMVRTQVPKGFDNRADPFIHPGEECVHIVEGALEITVGDRVFELSAGDTIKFDSGVPHSWRNRSGARAELMGAFTEAAHVTSNAVRHNR